MSKNQNSSQEFLIEHGVVAKRSVKQKQILGCIACCWNRTEQQTERAQVYGYEIAQCQNIESGTMYPVLNRIEDAGLVETEIEVRVTRGRPVRRYIVPSATNIGQEFRASLIIPRDCPLQPGS